MSEQIVISQEVVQAIAQATATAVVQGLSQFVTIADVVSDAPSGESANNARSIDEVNAENESKRTRRNHKRQAQAQPKAVDNKPVKAHYDCTRPVGSDGYIPGLVAGYKVPRELIDKAVNTHTQCNVRGCRKFRKGKARFCKAHGDENYKLMLAGKGGTLDEVKRNVKLS